MTTVALEQIAVRVGALDDNRALLSSRASSALSRGADVVVFPELATSGYVVDREVASVSGEALDGPTVERLTSITARHGGLIVTGFCERADGVVFNSVVAVGSEGPILHYRKLHLFDAERDVYEPGDLGLPVVDTEWGRLGACICYDLRFVEVLRVLSLRGADLVVAPAAWVGGFDPSVPVTGLTRQAEAVLVQANLDQVAVAAVSQVGASQGTGPAMLGGSVACDAFGELLAGPLSRVSPESALAEIRIEAGRSARIRSPRIRPREDRRTDVYGCRYEGVVL
jgi:N-carbamoylputrescine amidase